MEMPGGVSSEGPLCYGIQFGDVDHMFGGQGMSSLATSDLLGEDGEDRNVSRSLKRFRHVRRREWRNLSISGEKKKNSQKFRTLYSLFHPQIIHQKVSSLGP